MTNPYGDDPRQPQGYGLPPQQPWQPGPPPRYQPPPRPPRRRHTARNVLLITAGAVLVIIIIAVAAAAGHKTPPAAAPGITPSAPGHTASPAAPAGVVYEAWGSPAQVTYGPSGSTLNGRVPMKVTAKLEHADDYSLQAQLSGGGGAVHCRILVNGAVVSAATATGGYNIAMCEIVQDPLSGKWEDANTAG